MSIFRVEKDRNYTTINNKFVLDSNLSWKSKGLLAYILSRPDDWQFYLKEMIKHTKDGLDSTRTAIAELENNGYILRTRKRNDAGQLKEYEYIVFETPGKSELEPKSDFPTLENPTLLNTDLTNSYISIVKFLNETLNSDFKHTSKKTRSLIRARLNDGHTIDDFEKVISKKYKQWHSDSMMCKYLRPQTLFGTKFEAYLNEKTSEAKNESDYQDLTQKTKDVIL